MKALINRGAKACAVLGLCVLSAPAFATNGYFANGYGGQSKGMAGAGVAVSTGVLGMAQNPATGIKVGNGEGFLMWVAAARCALARPRPALENLPRWKPRGSWIRLWGKRAVGWGDRCIRGATEGEHGA